MTRWAMAALLFLGACGWGGSGSQGRILVQLSGEQEEISVYETLVESFEKQHEDIEVQLVPIADKDDHLAKLATSFAAGDPPDVFLVNFREYAQFVAQGAVEPVEEHVRAEGVDLADYYDQPIEAFTYRGRLQCMPQNVSNLVVYYNKRLFEHAELPHPPVDWSWAQFRSYARALTRGDVHGLGISPELIRIAPFVWSNQGDIVDDLDSPSRLTLDQPRAREALEFVVSLVRDDRVVPSESDVAAQDLETRFATGKLGMLLESRKETPALREVLGLDWDVAPLPQRLRPASILHSDAYCIAAGTDHVDEAATFISFATGDEGQVITALGGRTVPSLTSVARSNAFLDATRPPAHARAFLRQIPYLRRTPVIPTWPEIEDIAAEILTRAFYDDDYDIEQVITELDSRTRPLFDEARGP